MCTRMDLLAFLLLLLMTLLVTIGANNIDPTAPTLQTVTQPSEPTSFSVSITHMTKEMSTMSDMHVTTGGTTSNHTVQTIATTTKSLATRNSIFYLCIFIIIIQVII